MKKIFSHLTKHILRYLAVLIALGILAFLLRPQSGTPIETQTVKRGDLVQSLSETGTVDTATSANLSFLASGQLVYLGAQKGDTVKQGQTIAVLDQRTIQKNLETALRNYAEQRNTFDQTNDNNQNRTPQTALNDAMKRILQDNQYDLEKAVLSVQLQDLAKQQSVLTSPITGILTREDVTTPGVNVKTTDVFSVADPNHLVFKIDVDEADIGKVRVGEKATVTLDPYPDQVLNLTVADIDFTTHTTATGGNAYTVQVNLPANNNLTFRVGMNGDAEIVLDQRSNALLIPLSSLSDHFVYVQTAKGFEKRSVTIGLANDTNTEVLSGLQEGEKVALDPTEAAKVKSKRFFLF